MRIPANSTFAKELSKKFKQSFNKDTTFGELTTIKEKANEQETSSVAATVRQVNNERKEVVTEFVSNKGKKKDSCI